MSKGTHIESTPFSRKWERYKERNKIVWLFILTIVLTPLIIGLFLWPYTIRRFKAYKDLPK